MKKIITIIAFILIFASVITGIYTNIRASGEQQGSQIIKYSDPEIIDENTLFQRSAIVAEGYYTGENRVITVSSASGGDSSNFTEYSFVISHVYRGEKNNEDEVIIRIEGGITKDLNIETPCEPKLKEGENYLIFLYRPNTVGGDYNTRGDEYYYPTGGNQGVFKLISEDIYINDFGNISFTSEDFNERIELLKDIPINETWQRDIIIRGLRDNYESGMISETEYNVFISRLDQYGRIS